MTHFVLYLCMTALLACRSDKAVRKNIDYDLERPDRILVLEGALTEISGLSVYGNFLAAVQDETGVVYIIDKQTGETVEKHKFWKNGDFEGVEVVGEYLYVLKSNGNIYRMKARNPDKDDTKKFDTDLTGDHNFEGLGFNPESGELLMASKRSPSARTKEIYAVAPDNLKHSVRQTFLIDQRELYESIMKKKKRWIDRLAGSISLSNYAFNPSAIAVHPKSGDIYILSSPNPQILVLSHQWKFQSLTFLDPIKFRQPEGICFDIDGELYISNEGKGGTANILKFNQQ